MLLQTYIYFFFRMDACPNLLTEMPSLAITKPVETTKSANDHGTEISRSRVSSKFAFSRSPSLDHSSRIASRDIRERSSRYRDLTTAERQSRSRNRVTHNEIVHEPRESRFRMIAQSRDARNTEVDSVARSRDLPNRANRRSVDRRSLNADHRSADRATSQDRQSRVRREINEIRANRVDRSTDRRKELQRVTANRDRRSLSLERRVASEIGRRESREFVTGRRESRDSARRLDQRSEMRDRRSRLDERRAMIESLDADRSNRREDRRYLIDRSTRNVRSDVDRNNNLDRRNRERSLESRRVLLDRVGNREHGAARLSTIARDARGDSVRSNDRRSLSRTAERLGVDESIRETLGRRVRSVESEKSNGDRRSPSRRTTERREMDLGARRPTAESRLHLDRRSSDREASRRIAPEDTRRERTDRSQRVANNRKVAMRENSRAVRATQSSRYDLEESRERRERLARASSRSLARTSSLERQDIVRDAGDRRSRESSPERRGRTDRSYRSREERRVVALKKSRGDSERRATAERVVERRASRERILDRSHAGLSGRRVDPRGSRQVARSAEPSSAESRVPRARTLERRSVPESRSSTVRGAIGESSGSREDPTARRNLLQLPDPITARTMKQQTNSRTSAEFRDGGGRSLDAARRDFPRERRATRSIGNRLKESRAERETVERSRRRSSIRNSENLSRLASLRQFATVSRVSEQSRERRGPLVERAPSRAADDKRLSAKWGGSLRETRVDGIAEGIRAKAITDSIKNEFLKRPATYDLIRQAVVAALCTVYGFSLYNGKKSFIM